MKYKKFILFFFMFFIFSGLAVFAEDIDPVNIDTSIYAIKNQVNTEERGFTIKNGAIYDLAGNKIFDVSEDGKLNNGQWLDPNFRISYSQSDWARDSIFEAVKLDFIPVLVRYGYVDDINRYEFVSIIYNMLDKCGKIKNKDIDGNFNDINAIEVNALANLGIIAGKSETIFDPYSYITREEAAALMARVIEYIDLKTNLPHTDLYYDNEAIAEWAVDSVYTLRKMNIMIGEVIYDIGIDPVQCFNPKSRITKEESIVAIMRLYDMI